MFIPTSFYIFVYYALRIATSLNCITTKSGNFFYAICPYSFLRWQCSLSAKVNKTQTWVTVMTRISPSFKVGVSFWAISLCLILNMVLVADIFMNPKLSLDGRIYTLTVVSCDIWSPEIFCPPRPNISGKLEYLVWGD